MWANRSTGASDITVVFGTLGFTPQKFLPFVRSYPDVEEVVLFYDQHEASQKARHEVAMALNSMQLRVKSVEVDAFDLVDAAVLIRKELRQHQRSKVRFNITGGTKVLTSAALLACVLEGVSASYLHDETLDEIRLPLLTMRYEEQLTRAHREALSHLQMHADCTPTHLGEVLGVRRSTAAYHVRTLLGYGLITKHPDQNDLRVHRLNAIPSVRLLIGIENHGRQNAA